MVLHYDNAGRKLGFNYIFIVKTDKTGRGALSYLVTATCWESMSQDVAGNRDVLNYRLDQNFGVLHPNLKYIAMYLEQWPFALNRRVDRSNGRLVNVWVVLREQSNQIKGNPNWAKLVRQHIIVNCILNRNDQATLIIQ